jgi:hypothetical protein
MGSAASQRKLIDATSRTKRSADCAPGCPQSPLRSQTRRAHQPVVIVLDNGPVHVSKATAAALAAAAFRSRSHRNSPRCRFSRPRPR